MQPQKVIFRFIVSLVVTLITGFLATGFWANEIGFIAGFIFFFALITTTLLLKNFIRALKSIME